MSEQFNFVAVLDIDQIFKAFDAVDKRADKSADNMTKAFQRIQAGAGKGTAKAATDAEKKAKAFDATLKKLIATELRAAAGSDKLTKDFINLTASVKGSSSAFINAVSQTDRLSKAQIDFAVSTARTKARIAEATRELSKEGANVAALNREIRQLQGSLNRMDDAQEQAAASAQRVTDEVREQAAEIKKQSAVTAQATKKTKTGAAKSSLAMGVLAGATAAVTNQLIQLARRAVTTFNTIIKGAVDTAIKFEGVERSFGAVFGDPSIADAVFDRVQERSAELGVDLTQLSRKFLPLVGSVEQALKFGELAASLALFDPEQGITGALISLQELAVGDVVSLRKRFELPTGKIQQFQKELGNVDGALVGLGILLEERGVSIEQLGDIGQIVFARLLRNAKQLQGTLGEPIVEVLTDSLIELNEFIKDNRDELELVAISLGDIVAAVAEFSGDELNEFFKELDLGDTIDSLQAVVGLIDSLAVVSDAVSDTALADVFKAFEAEEGITGLERVRNGARNLIGVIGILDATIRGTVESLAVLASVGKGVLDGSIDSVEDFREVLERGIATVEDAYIGRLEEIKPRLQEVDAALDENIDKMEERRIEQARSTEADLAAANAMLELKNATNALEAANAELADESADVREKIEKLRQSTIESSLKAEADFQRKLLDIAQDTSEKRIDLARKTLVDIKEIRIKFQNAITDAGTGFDRKEQDIARKNADRIFDIEEDAIRKKIEAEDDFQEKLAAIRRKFDFKAEEAIRDNDAVALLRIRRQAEFELNEAKIQRKDKESEEDAAAQERVNKANLDAEREREAASIGNQRKLEDLDKSLARELAAKKRTVDEELRTIAIGEERRREEAELNFERSLEDINRQLRIKIEALLKSLEDEVAAVQDAERRKTAAAVAGIQARLNAQLAAIGKLQKAAAAFVPLALIGDGTNGDTDRTFVPGGGIKKGRQKGGPARANEPVVVGEPLPGGRPNPEIFVPGSDGFITPLSRFMFNPSQQGTSTQIIDNSRSLSADVSIPDPSGLSPIQKAQVVALATDILVQANRGSS